MLKKGLGLAFGRDTQETAVRAARRTLEQNPSPQLAFLFASTCYDQELLFSTLRRELGYIPIFGASSPIVITNLGVSRDSVALLTLSGPELNFDIQAGLCEDPEKTASYLCTRHLFEKGMPGPAKGSDTLLSCILTGTEAHSRGNLYLKGISATMPHPIPVSGGASVGIFPSDDTELIHSGYQYCGDIIAQNYLNLLFLNLPKALYSLSYAYESSWKPVAHPVRCTKTNHNLVSQVDDIPVFQYLEKALGKGFQDHLVYTRPRFSFVTRHHHGDQDKALVRPVTNWDRENGCVSFWPYADMQDQEIQLVQLSRDDLLTGTGTAAAQALEQLKGSRPEAVLVFSCTIRSLLLHSRADEEIEQIKKVFGPEVPIIGFYCNAEYSPMYNDYESIVNPDLPLSGSQQFGCSVAIMAIGSRDQQQSAPGADAGIEKSCPNFMDLLSIHQDQDNRSLALTDTERIDNLEKMLRQAESIISENESALKYIIAEHHRTNLELRDSNRDLQQANEVNERLKEVIRQYTPHNVWKKASVSVMAGLYSIPDEEMHCALMFMDVKGFTAYAETHSPQQVIGELNKLFRPATELIYKYQGDIDKYIGDCIFAMFRDPGQALQCALDIQARARTESCQGSPFNLRVGINYGRIVSGNVGADLRRENALIGDAVNLAQRLESACPQGGVLVSDELYQRLSQELRSSLPWKSYSIRVKGKEMDIEVHEIPSDSISCCGIS